MRALLGKREGALTLTGRSNSDDGEGVVIKNRLAWFPRLIGTKLSGPADTAECCMRKRSRDQAAPSRSNGESRSQGSMSMG